MLGYIIYGDEAGKRPALGDRQLSGGNFVTLEMRRHPLPCAIEGHRDRKSVV